MNNDSKITAVNRVQEYVKDHLKTHMSLSEIANHTGYSPWHISKIFKEFTGKTIFEYIRLLRLTKAALNLRDSEALVIDVALEFIFDTHEGFTRAFSKEFGITPKKYSLQTPPIKLFLPYPAIDLDQIKKGAKSMKNETTIVFTQVIERPQRKAIIKRGVKADEYFSYCEEVGCEIWGELCSIKGALYEPMGMWLPQKLITRGTSEYVQGVEIPYDYNGIIPDGYDVITLEACKMMIFQGPKFEDKNFQEEVAKVMRAIEEYDPSPFGFEWADDSAPSFQYAPLGSRGYIEGRPVKMIV